ncbi:MAG: S8 family serine peptidase [Bryobacterales bacterium]|nr:S8 family serine peptidase [Bryobacterales bacterium]
MTGFSILGRLLLSLATLTVVHAGERLILKTHPDKLATVLSRYNLADVRKLKQEGGETTHVVSARAGVTAAQVVAVTHGDSDVRSIEADSELEIEESHRSVVLPASPASLPDCARDTSLRDFFAAKVRAGYLTQPSNSMVRAGEAHARGVTGAGIVAIVDTGVDPLHPALRSVLLPGYDFTRDLPGIATDWLDLPPAALGLLSQSTVAILDTGSMPTLLNQSTVAILDQSTVAILDQLRKYQSFGHGTMVAGLVHLVAPTARIMPLKAFHADGTAKLSDIARAIRYAVDHQASVINLSFSMPSLSAELSEAILYARSKKVVVIASAGNAGKEKASYPAAFTGVIGVGSVNLADVRSYFSNYGGSNSKTSAPGEGLLTAYPGNRYAAVWGTSFSAALVSGAVSLMKQLKNDLDSSKVKDALDHGRKVEQKMGDARLDVMRMLSYVGPAR